MFREGGSSWSQSHVTVMRQLDMGEGIELLTVTTIHFVDEETGPLYKCLLNLLKQQTDCSVLVVRTCNC